jgi:hypothetical protein
MIGFYPDSGWPVYRTRSTPEALFMSILVMCSTKRSELLGNSRMASLVLFARLFNSAIHRSDF